MGDGGGSGSGMFTVQRKREWKMKTEIRPTFTGEEHEEDEDQANRDERVENMETLIAAVIRAQKPPQQQQPSSKTRAHIRLHKVPAWLRQSLQSPNKYFDPEVVALGPFHHDHTHLKQFQRIKVSALRHYVDLLLPAAGGGSSRVDDPYNSNGCVTVVQYLWEAVANEVLDEKQQAKHYPGKATSTYGGAEALVCMMLLDGCFLLHFIECNYTIKAYPGIGDHVFHVVVRDMFLLENQIPFAVLRALNKAIYGPREGSMKSWIVHFLCTRILFPNFYNLTGRSWILERSGTDDNKLLQLLDDKEWERVTHLLYLLRHFVLGKPPAPPSGQAGLERANKLDHSDDGIPLRAFGSGVKQKDERRVYEPPLHAFGSVVELKDAGIKFTNSNARHLTEIAFKKNVLFPEILVPPIVITPTTICYILNMIAWEQHLDNPTDRSITSYVCFLNSVINHAEDVKELRLRRVLYHGLGSDEEVADLFNHWPIDDMGELPVHREISEYIYQHRRTHWKLSVAEFVYTHFRSPWSAISLVAAIVLLLLTLLQTIFAIKQPSNSPPPPPPSLF